MKTKLELKYNAIKIASAPSLDGLGSFVATEYFHNESPLVFTETNKNIWSATTGRGKLLENFFAVKSGNKYYFMSRC